MIYCFTLYTSQFFSLAAHGGHPGGRFCGGGGGGINTSTRSAEASMRSAVDEVTWSESSSPVTKGHTNTTHNLPIQWVKITSQ